MESKTTPDIEDLIYSRIKSLPPVENHAVLLPTSMIMANKDIFLRDFPVNDKPFSLKNEFSLPDNVILTDKEALQEASRCLRCVDAPCRYGCPSSINIKAFISCLANSNYYGAASIILTNNPLGYTCGLVCPASQLCRGNCTLKQNQGGPINIPALQAYAVNKFLEHNIKISLPKPNNFSNEKIALVGAGPASLSCATYLARLGYKNITIFEKDAFPGGICTAEIPNYRLPQDVSLWEIKLVRDYEVKFEFNKLLGKNIMLSSLSKDYRAVFLGIGHPHPQQNTAFNGATNGQGYYTSKEFLQLAAKASKSGLLGGDISSLPSLFGHVIVLGGGDVAMDCATTALRCGAESVTICIRRKTTQLRASIEEIDHITRENIDILSHVTPKSVIINGGHINGVVMRKLEYHKTKGFPDGEQTVNIACDFIISAFGAVLEDKKRILAPLFDTEAESEDLRINPLTGMTGTAGIFAGGDLIGSTMVVQAVNDGKIAAHGIDAYIHQLHSLEAPNVMPVLSTAIDNVDVSCTLAGVKLLNPFLLASAPPCTSMEMIERCYQAGWAGAVVKTFSLDKDLVTNVTPRIMGLRTDGKGVSQPGFINIELISEKTASYWCSSIKYLKKKYPKHCTISSIMAGLIKEDWQELTRMSNETGCDIIEMNLSCPHGMHERGMGLALGTFPDYVAKAVGWVVEVSKVPVFAKLTPNVTDITAISEAAMSAGAAGVTAINTISGLIGFHTDGTPKRHGVGEKMLITAGGLSGGFARPLALRAVAYSSRTHLASHKKPLPIMATGSIDSAQSCLEFIRAGYCQILKNNTILGASAVQICSSVMNEDRTVIYDYITGLQELLYHYKHHIQTKNVPVHLFGIEEQNRIAREHLSLGKSIPPIKIPDSIAYSDAPSVDSLVGSSVPFVKDYNDLSNKEQLIPFINEDLCLRCGRCYATCTDSGYQAIEFSSKIRCAESKTNEIVKLHLPKILEEECTCCGLCESVCPSPGCITFVKRKGLKPPVRGHVH